MPHTPGPWEIVHGVSGTTIRASSHRVATVHARLNNPLETQEDDAALIAAAPDLLDAAKLVLATWEDGDLAKAVRSLQKVVDAVESS